MVQDIGSKIYRLRREKKLTQEEAENILKMRTVYDGTTPVSASATPSATKSASN